MNKQNFHQRFPDWAMPSEADWQRSAHLQARIKAKIQRQGAIPFAGFMEMALYEPELGYYAVHKTKFGALGDFTTAPNITPIFSQCIANQCRQVLDLLSGIGRGNILEVGAGNGKMASDILLYLAREKALPKRYLILERSEGLQAMQRQYLQETAPHLLAYVRWVDAVPSPFDGIIIGNELLDAMPAQRFQWEEGGCYQWAVALDDNQCFHEVRQPVSDETQQKAIKALSANLASPFSAGYCSEINFQALDWVTQAATCLRQGMLLLIDYGYPQKEYYHPQRTDGTRVCFYRHHRHNDPLILVGLQDISCHVDFTAVTEVAVGSGLDLSGFSTQAGFLMGCGIMQRLAEAQQAQGNEALSASITLNNQVEQLLAPSEMGELVKAIGFQKGLDDAMIGFSMQDISFRL